MIRAQVFLCAGLAAAAIGAAPAVQSIGAVQAERVAIAVDAGKTVGPMKPIWAWFGYDEPNYTYMKDGQEAAVRAVAAEPGAGVRPHAQSADDRRRHAGAEVGIDQRLHRGCQRQADLRLDDRRSHHRHLPRAQDEAARADRLHARGAVDRSRSRTSTTGSPATTTTTSTPAGPIRRRTTPSGASSSISGSSTRSRSTAGPKSRAGGGRSGTSPTSATGRARPRST